MLQVKFFKSIENEITGLEKEINTWIATQKVKVVSITGNIAPQSPQSGGAAMGATTLTRFTPSDVLVIVTYEKVG